MNKRVFLLVFIPVFLLFALDATHFTTLAAVEPATIKVPEDYPTIQTAINAANPGDIIQVAAGTYYEHVTVNKSLTLVGENRNTTVISTNGTGMAIYVTADNVNLSGFTIRDIGLDFSCVLLNSRGNSITGNVIIPKMGYGITLNSSSDNRISDNTVSNYWIGIVVQDSTNNTITRNKIGPGSGLDDTGILLGSSSGNRISNNIISDNVYDGIRLILDSNNNTISGNNLLNNGYGVYIILSSNNTISNNLITNNGNGVKIEVYGGNTIRGNMISDNYVGISLYKSSQNIIYHNNLINNTDQVRPQYTSLSSNTWDNGAEGNYWSDYAGEDVNGDGIGDTNLPHLGVDNYPLMVPWSALRVFKVEWKGVTYRVTTYSNSTIASFNFSESFKQISFNITGPSDTTGFCNVTIPKTLLRDNATHPWIVLIDRSMTTYIKSENETHTSLHFNYNQSTYRVQIIGAEAIPEISAAIFLLLFIIISLCAVILRRKIKPQNIYIDASKPASFMLHLLFHI